MHNTYITKHFVFCVVDTKPRKCAQPIWLKYTDFFSSLNSFWTFWQSFFCLGRWTNSIGVRIYHLFIIFVTAFGFFPNKSNIVYPRFLFAAILEN